LAEFAPVSVDHRRTHAVQVPSSSQPSSCPQWLRPEPVDPAEDLGEQRSRNRHLGQLENHVTAMAHEPGADLDQLLAQGFTLGVLAASMRLRLGQGLLSYLDEPNGRARGPAEAN
jgi:hypothetical protein